MLRPLIFFLILNTPIATSYKQPNEVKRLEFDYAEYIRQKLNKILEIEEGNYWEGRYKIESKENKLKEYLK